MTKEAVAVWLSRHEELMPFSPGERVFETFVRRANSRRDDASAPRTSHTAVTSCQFRNFHILLAEYLANQGFASITGSPVPGNCQRVFEGAKAVTASQA